MVRVLQCVKVQACEVTHALLCGTVDSSFSVCSEDASLGLLCKRYDISAIIYVPIRSGATRAAMLAVGWWLQVAEGGVSKRWQ